MNGFIDKNQDLMISCRAWSMMHIIDEWKGNAFIDEHYEVNHKV